MKRDERVNRIGLEAPRRLLQYLNQSLGKREIERFERICSIARPPEKKRNSRRFETRSPRYSFSFFLIYDLLYYVP